MNLSYFREGKGRAIAIIMAIIMALTIYSGTGLTAGSAVSADTGATKASRTMSGDPGNDPYTLKIVEAKVTASNPANLYAYRKSRATSAAEYNHVGLGFGGDMYQKPSDPAYYTYMLSGSLSEPRQFTFEATFNYSGTFDPANVAWWHGSGGTSNTASNKPMTSTTGGTGAAWTKSNYQGSGSTALFTLVGTPNYDLSVPGECTATATFNVDGGLSFSKSQFTDTRFTSWNPMRNATTRIYYNNTEVASRPFRIPQRDYLYSWLEHSEWIAAIKPTVSEWYDVNGSKTTGNGTYAINNRYVALESTGKCSGFTTTSSGTFMRYPQKDIWCGVIADSKASVDYYHSTVSPTMNSGTASDVLALKNDPDARMVIYYSNIHADECHGSDAVMYLFQELAKAEKIYSTKTSSTRKVAGSGTNPDYNARGTSTTDTDFDIDIDDLLSKYIFVFNFMENPDGRDYGGRYANYRFDPNRDGGVQALPESVASKRNVARWDPLSFVEFHSSRSRIQIDPCTAPHDANYEADLYYTGGRTSGQGMMNRQAHAMGSTLMGTQSNASYVVPEEDIVTANEKFDDIGPNYSPQYAMLLGSLAVTVESEGETARDVLANTILSYGALEDQYNNWQDYWDFKIEYKKRGVTNENTDSKVNPYLYSANKLLTPILNRQYPAGATKFFPDYYIIPMDDSQLDCSQALEAVRYLTRSKVAVEVLTTSASIGGKTYPAGTYVVDMKQGNRYMANMALSKGMDACRSGALYSAYNVMNLPALRGFTCDWAEGSAVLSSAPANYTVNSGLKKISDDRNVTRLTADIQGSGSTVIIKNSGLDSLRLVFAALGAAGQTAYPVKMITGTPPTGFKQGDFVMSYANYQSVNTGGNRFFVEGTRVSAEPAGVTSLVRPKVTVNLGGTYNATPYAFEQLPLAFEKLGMRVYGGGPINETGNAADMRLNSQITGQNVIINFNLAIDATRNTTITNALNSKSAGLIQVGVAGMATAGGYLGTGFTRGSAGGNEGILTATYANNSIITTRMENSRYVYTGSTEYLSTLPAGAVPLVTSKNTGTSTLDYDPASSFIAGKSNASQKAAMKGKVYAAAGTYLDQPNGAPVVLFGDDIFNKAHNEGAWRMLGNAMLVSAAGINPNIPPTVIQSPDTDISLSEGPTKGTTLVSWAFNSIPASTDYALLEYAIGGASEPTSGWTSLPDDDSVTIGDLSQSQLGKYVYLRFAANGSDPASPAIKSAIVTGAEIKDFEKLSQSPLSINAVTGKRVGMAPFQLTVSGGSGTGAVTYELVSGDAATVTSGGLVTILDEGDIVVKATKAADEDYDSITSANLTITIQEASTFEGDVFVSTWAELVVELGKSTNSGKEIGLTEDIDIPSSGAQGNVTVDGITVNGNGFTLKKLPGFNNNVFNSTATTLTLKNLTIDGNNVSPGPAHGGAVMADSSSYSLTVENCVFINNVTAGRGGAIYGGNTASSGCTLTATNCAFINNKANGGSGGATTSGNSTITNCTYYGNTSTGSAALLIAATSNTATITNCTVVGNTAVNPGGVYGSSASLTTIKNSIIIGNNSATNPNVRSVGDGGYNLFGTISSVTLAPTSTGNIAYPVNWLAAAPANNGGYTPTMALINTGSSPAISKILTGAPAADQRGITRKPLSDIGAYEYIPVSGVTLNKTTLRIPLGQTSQLIADVEPSYASVKDVTWSSSDDLIATVSASGLVTAEDVGTADIEVKTVDGNKTDTCAVEVFEPIDISGGIVIKIPNQEYTGSDIEPVVKVYFNGDYLVEGTDYEVAYEDNKDIGEATVTITGKGEYTGTLIDTFNIVAIALDKDSYVAPTASDITIGQSLAASKLTGGSVKDKAGNIVDGHFVWVKPSTVPPSVGTYTAQVTFTPEEDIYKSARFDVDVTVNAKVQTDINGAIVVKIPDKEYTGSDIEPTIQVSYKGETLAEGTDYEVTYQDNKDIGEATITITGKGDYTGTLTAKFNIVPISLDNASYVAPTASDITIGQSLAASKLTGGSVKDKAGNTVDGHFVWVKPSTVPPVVGTYTAQVTFTPEEDIYKSARFDVDVTVNAKVQTDISSGAIVIKIPDQEYTGSDIEPTVQVSYKGETLTEGTDYEVTFQDNKDIGEVTVTITGKAEYTGSFTATFNIVPISLDNASYVAPTAGGLILGQALSNSKLTGGSIQDKKGNLVEGHFAWVKPAIVPDEVGVFTAQVIFTPEEDIYKSARFDVDVAVSAKEPRLVADIEPVDPITDEIYTGEGIEPLVKTMIFNPDIEREILLKEGEDYVVSYLDNIDVGYGKVVITGAGEYSGTKEFDFKILPQKGAVKKLIAKKGKMTVKWGKAVDNAGKYQIRYKVKGTKKWKIKTVSGSKTSIVLKKLKKGKKYQVQVRAFKTIDEEKWVGKWSKTKTSKKIK